MRTKLLILFAAFVLWSLGGTAWAANHYVRAGATGPRSAPPPGIACHRTGEGGCSRRTGAARSATPSRLVRPSRLQRYTPRMLTASILSCGLHVVTGRR